MKRYSKYRILFSAESMGKAEKHLGKLKNTEETEIHHRKFTGKDKSRYYVRELVRKGAKQ